MSTVVKFPLHVIGLFLRTVGAGITPILVLGVSLWVFDKFFSQIDLATQKVFFDFFASNTDERYAGFGILLLIGVAFVLGFPLPFLPGAKKLGDYFSFWKIISLIGGKNLRGWHLFEVQTQTIIKFGSGPDKEMLLFPIYSKALVHITRQWITNDDGSREELIVYDALLATAPVLQSGPLPRIDPGTIEFVLDNNPSQLILFLFTLGRAGYIWNRRKFNPEEFLPV